MTKTICVPLCEVVSQFHMEVAWRSTDYDKLQVTVEDVARPGLQLSGYYEHFEPMRLQVLGNVESSYLNKMTPEERYRAYDRLFSYRIPAVIAARGLQPGAEMLAAAEKHNVTILTCKDATSHIVSSIITYLKRRLASGTTVHGVLMEIYGEGVLIMGESGVGKSETAVELIKRGHRLIADDVVEVKRVSADELVGTPPPAIRNYIELRGIGIVNAQRTFGAGAIKDAAPINLVVKLTQWDPHTDYDRLGLECHHKEFLGIQVPLNIIPIQSGRNLAIILEVAAMTNRQRRMGYNAAQEFTSQLSQRWF